MTAINFVLPNIISSFNVSISSAQWLINGYLTAAAAIIPTTGRMIEHYGLRKIMIIGISLFIISSFVVGVAPELPIAIIARIFQGVGFSIIFPGSILVLRTTFEKSQHGFIMGLVGMTAGLAQALGPSLGGLAVLILDWRWIFFINIPIGIFILCTLSAFVRNPESPAVAKKMQVNGIVSLIVMLFSFITLLNNLSNDTTSALMIYSLIAFTLIMMSLFYIYQRKSAHPIIDFHLFRNKRFISFVSLRSIMQVILFSLLFIMGIFLQKILGLPIGHASVIMLGLTLTFGVISFFVGKLIGKIATYILAITGFCFFILASILFILLHTPISIYYIVTILILFGLGTAFLLSPLMDSMLNSVTPKETASAIGINYTIGFMSAGIAAPILNIIMRHPIDSKAKELISLLKHVDRNTLLSSMQNIFFHSQTTAIFHSKFHQVSYEKLITILKVSYLHGLSVMSAAYIAVSVIGILLILKIQSSSTTIQQTK